MQNKQQLHVPVAIVGISAIFPGSVNARGFWRDILGKTDRLTEVPPTHWLIEDYYDPDPRAPDKTYGRRGGFIPDIPFDPMAFGIPPNQLEATDSGQLLALLVAKQVLEDAHRGQFASANKERISVVLGTTGATELILDMASRMERPKWIKSLREEGLDEETAQRVCDRIAAHYAQWQESSFPGLLPNVVAGRIAHKLDLGGTNYITDAACASSFAAMNVALNELYLRQSDLVITGGVDALNTISMFMCFSKTPALSPTGDCRPFSEDADGTMLGEGIGMVALKRLEDAERDGDSIYAVIRGLGASSDGKSSSVYAPLPEGQARAIRRAYANAGYAPHTVELIEAHGTATRAGDTAELQGLGAVFEAAGQASAQSVSQSGPRIALGSVKSNIGHTKAAAGVAGLIKVTLALQHKILPPTIKVKAPNPKLVQEPSAFYLNTEARPWIRGASHPRRASVSSFGFGGTNFHVTVEEYPNKGQGDGAARPRLRQFKTELFLFSAPTAEALQTACREAMSGPLESELAFRLLAAASQQHFDAADARRLALVATDAEDLRRKLDQALGGLQQATDAPFALPSGVYYGVGAQKEKLGFLFPGQGSQYLNMGAELAMAFDAAREAWDEIAESELWANGPALHQLAFPPPAFTDQQREAQEARLKETHWAQPAIANMSASQLRLLRELGLRPDGCAGHSLGELTALHAAGAFDHETLISIARRRGQLMDAAAQTPGAMLAVRASAEVVEDLLRRWESGATVANYNSPEQTILAGTAQEIAEIKIRFESENCPCALLPVATAFHSGIVAPAAQPFQEFLEGVAFRPAALPVYANLDGTPYPDDCAEGRRQLGEQLIRPVRFVDQVERMYADGIRVFVEVGPQAALTGLVESILRGRDYVAIALDRKGQDGVTQFWRALGQLAVAGYALDLARLLEGYETLDPSPAHSSKPLSVSINGANYAKRYPPKEGAAGLPKPNSAPAPHARPAQMDASHPNPAHANAQHKRPPDAHPQNGAHPQDSAQSPAQGSIPATPAFEVFAPPADWLAAFQQAQQQTLEAHVHFQKTMAESHQAFLKAAELSMMGLTHLADGLAPAQPTPFAAGIASQAIENGENGENRAAPAFSTTPTVAPVTPLHPVTPFKGATPASSFGGSTPEAEAPVTRAPNPPDRQDHSVRQAIDGQFDPTTQSKPNGQLNLDRLTLQIVSEKTGYPAEMLNLDMELDNDLGIDSIKRVEIFATLMEQAPELQSLDTSELAKRSTLGQIVAYVQDHLRGQEQAQTQLQAHSQPTLRPNSNATQPGLDGQSKLSAHLDLDRLTLQIVSEKTGYPAEMLNFDMELDNDLGIDSIKRVEIFATLMEQAPELQSLDTSELAKRSTLGQIVAYVQDHLRGQARASSGTATETQPSDVAESALLTNAAPVIERFALEWVEAPATGWGPAALRPGAQVALTDDATGVARALAERLSARGLNVRVFDAKAAQDAYNTTFDADALIFLGGLAPVNDHDAARRIQREAFQLARAFASRFTERGGLFITVQDTGGRFGVGKSSELAWLGGLAGLAKTAAIEWPQSTVKAIDLERGGRAPEALADALAEEILYGGMEREVGLPADGARGTLVSVARPGRASTTPGLPHGAVVVASGGARGVTAASLLALAEAIQPRLAILGRAALEDEPASCAGVIDEAGLKRVLLDEALSRGETLSPVVLNERVRRTLANREIRSTLRRLQAAGAEVRYIAADIRDGRAVRAALDRVRAEWGPIEGLVHGAGVIADKRIAEKKDEQFDLVFSTKVDGLRALLEGTTDDPLRSIALFSSVAGRTGNLGQCDYAMGNETLNKVASLEYARRQGACRVKSINWGPWESGMVSPQLKARFTELGVPLIPLETGARMFVEEFLGASPDEANDEVEIVVGGRPTGAALLGTAEPAQSEWTLTISAQNYGFLKGHQIKGETVVPFTLVHEWFHRISQSCRRDLRVVEIRDFKALKGIVLRDFDGAGETFTICLTPTLAAAREASFRIELRGQGGALHYQATAILREADREDHPRRQSTSPETFGAMDVGWPLPQAYDGEVLFHRGIFKVIRGIEGVGSKGIVGEVAAREDMPLDAAALPSEASRAILLDGALQLAVLWHWRRVGGGSLPLAIGSVKIYGDFGAGPLRCEISGRLKSRDLASVDLQLSNPSGEVVAEIRALELVVYFQKEFAAGATQ
jgi:acyl transferase domain-containing protein/acyl carrier protein